jgi:hypothetical protein
VTERFGVAPILTFQFSNYQFRYLLSLLITDADLTCSLEIRWKPWNNIYYFVFCIWLTFKSALLESRMRWDVVTMYCSVIHCSSFLFFFLRSLATETRLFDSNGEPLVSWRGLPSLHTLKRNRNHTRKVGAFLYSARVSRQLLCWSHCKTQPDKINKQFYYSSLLSLTKPWRIIGSLASF